MAPGPLLGGDMGVGDAMGDELLGGRYDHGGGKGGGGSFGHRGRFDFISDGGEDMAAGRTVGSARAFSPGARGGGGGGVADRSDGRGVETRGNQDMGRSEGERGGRGCSRGCESRGGGYNVEDEGTRSHAHKRRKVNSNDVMFSTPPPHPVLYSSELQIRSSAMSAASRSRSSSLGEKNCRDSAAKRVLEFQEVPYHHKMHDLFVCPMDLGVTLGSLADYAARYRKVNLEIPPGDHNGDAFLSPVNDTRALIRRSVKTLQLLHEGDKSLRGKFDFSNFRVDSRKRVKLDTHMSGNLVALRKSHSDADYEKFALQVHAHFSRGIPTELKGWMRLLLKHSTEEEYLIVQSISLMEPMKAVAHFLNLHGELLALRNARQEDYEYVIDYLGERHPHWKRSAKNNSLIEHTLLREDPETLRKAVYNDKASDLLRLCRNFIAHILGKYKGRRLLQRISYKDILAIINSVFPGLLFDFQTAMHHLGILKRLLEFQ